MLISTPSFQLLKSFTKGIVVFFDHRLDPFPCVSFSVFEEARPSLSGPKTVFYPRESLFKKKENQKKKIYRSVRNIFLQNQLLPSVYVVAKEF